MKTAFEFSDNNDLGASKTLLYFMSKLVTPINLGFYFQYIFRKKKTSIVTKQRTG